MKAFHLQPRLHRHRGFSLIEVLVTIALITLGILGVFGLQSRAANIELESYQRSQALSLAREMESVLRASRTLRTAFSDPALSSTDGSVYVGVDGNVTCSTPAANAAEASICAWGDALRGASLAGSGTLGGMVGARGCVIRPASPQAGALADFYVAVVWQGIAPSNEPPANSMAATCFSGGGLGFGDGLRRGLSLRVLVPQLASTSP